MHVWIALEEGKENNVDHKQKLETSRKHLMNYFWKFSFLYWKINKESREYEEREREKKKKKEREREREGGGVAKWCQTTEPKQWVEI